MTAAEAHLRRLAALVGADDASAPVERRVRVGPLGIRVRDWGPEEARPVVFLHGAGLTAHTWDAVCLRLRPAVRCLAADLRGHGDSDWAPDGDYRVDALAADLGGLIATLELTGPVLVGHSLGGLTALRHAVTGGTPSGLVLVDVGLEPPQAHGAAHIRRFLTAPRELPTIEAFVERALEFNPRRDAELLRTSLRNNLRELPSGAWTWKYDPAAVGRDPTVVAAIRAEIRRRLGRVRCPALVVRGERSNVLTREAARALAEALPDGRWAEVPDAGHTIQGDNPRALEDLLRGFLAT